MNTKTESNIILINKYLLAKDIPLIENLLTGKVIMLSGQRDDIAGDSRDLAKRLNINTVIYNDLLNPISTDVGPDPVDFINNQVLIYKPDILIIVGNSTLLTVYNFYIQLKYIMPEIKIIKRGGSVKITLYDDKTGNVEYLTMG